MPTPTHPNLLAIRVYGRDKTSKIESATVTLTSGTSSTSSSTKTNGEVVFNIANLTTWSAGDEVTITSTKAGIGTDTQTVTLTNSPQTLTVYLAETSSMTYLEEPTTHVLNFALLTSFDGEKITTDNPLPVTHGEIDLINNPSTIWSITRTDGQPDYEEVTMSGVTYRRTFTYTNNIMTARSSWVRQ